jgi:hypothetical protein
MNFVRSFLIHGSTANGSSPAQRRGKRYGRSSEKEDRRRRRRRPLLPAFCFHRGATLVAQARFGLRGGPQRGSEDDGGVHGEGELEAVLVPARCPGSRRRRSSRPSRPARAHAVTLVAFSNRRSWSPSW